MDALRGRLVVALLLLLAISTVKSCDEIRYAISGTIVKPIRATISEDRPPRVEYEFMDGPQRRVESDRPLFGSVAEPVMIEYIPGSETSRIARGREWWWIILPGALLVAIAYHSWRFWKLYKS